MEENIDLIEVTNEINESNAIDVARMNKYIQKYMDKCDNSRIVNRIIGITFLVIISLICYFKPIQSMRDYLENKSLTYETIDYFKSSKNNATSVNVSTHLVWPASGTITSDYGYSHTGVDISCTNHRDPIYASANGTVILTGDRSDGYGNAIGIAHDINGERIYTFYAHLSSIKVYTGQYVEQGQIIGYEGGDPYLDPNPGNSTGHHLHFEVRKTPEYGSHVNPYQYLK